MSEFVVLVDEQDNQTGLCEKLEAHKMGLLHRAFSICLFNSKNEVLLQQRALRKYHCPGLWTNACCSHPRNEELVAVAAHRRLQEELGFDCEIKKTFSFIYKAALDNGLTEHEFDHVFIGTYNGPLTGWNKDEVHDLRWVLPRQLDKEMSETPKRFTPWFLLLWDHFHKEGIIKS